MSTELPTAADIVARFGQARGLLKHLKDAIAEVEHLPQATPFGVPDRDLRAAALSVYRMLKHANATLLTDIDKWKQKVNELKKVEIPLSGRVTDELLFNVCQVSPEGKTEYHRIQEDYRLLRQEAKVRLGLLLRPTRRELGSVVRRFQDAGDRLKESGKLGPAQRDELLASFAEIESELAELRDRSGVAERTKRHATDRFAVSRSDTEMDRELCQLIGDGNWTDIIAAARSAGAYARREQTLAKPSGVRSKL